MEANRSIEEKTNWTKPVDGIIHVPDHLDKFFNYVGMQLRFHTISGLNEAECIAHIVHKHESELAKQQAIDQGEIDRLKNKVHELQDLYHIRQRDELTVLKSALRQAGEALRSGKPKDLCNKTTQVQEAILKIESLINA